MIERSSNVAIADVAIAPDADRCLVDVDACVQVLQEAYDSERKPFRLPAIDLVRLQDNTEDTLSSFSPYSTVCDFTDNNPEAFNKIFDRFVYIGRTLGGILYPDSLDFIHTFTEQGFPLYINTRGVEFEWQRYKLDAASLGAIPTAMTTARDKGLEHTRNRVVDEHGVYYAPQNIMLRGRHIGLAARHIIGVDDYKSNLVNSPSDTLSVWLDRPESRQNKKQLKERSLVLPPHVQTAHSLQEAAEQIQEYIKDLRK